jgi:hypothetical protein
MNEDTMQIFNRYADFLNLCSLGALLHDLGKLSVHFILSKERGSPVEDIHGQIIFRDRMIVPPRFLTFLSTGLEHLCEVPPAFRGFSLLFFMCSHHGCLRCAQDHRCGSGEMMHHPLVKMLQAADRQDTSHPADANKQSLLGINGSDVWGREYALHPERFSLYRKRLYEGLTTILGRGDRGFGRKVRSAELLLKKYLSRGLSETRKWSHDIDIFSHVRSTAIYLRMMLIDHLLCRSSKPCLESMGRQSAAEVRFRMARIFCRSLKERERASWLMEYGLCAGALIYSAPSEMLFYTGASIDELTLGQFLDLPFELSRPYHSSVMLDDLGDDFPPRTPWKKGTIALSLQRSFAFFNDARVLDPGDIAPGYSMKDLMEGIEMVAGYGDFLKLLKLGRKRKSIESHLKNLRKGYALTGSFESQGALLRALSRLEAVEREMARLPPPAYFEKRWEWRRREDASIAVWNFLSLVLSPVRPPSPHRLTERWKNALLEHGGHATEAVVMKLVLRKHPHLSRFFSLLRSAGKAFNAPAGYGGRESTDLSRSFLPTAGSVDFFQRKNKKLMAFFDICQ